MSEIMLKRVGTLFAPGVMVRPLSDEQHDERVAVVESGESSLQAWRAELMFNAVDVSERIGKDKPFTSRSDYAAHIGAGSSKSNATRLYRLGRAILLFGVEPDIERGSNSLWQRLVKCVNDAAKVRALLDETPPEDASPEWFAGWQADLADAITAHEAVVKSGKGTATVVDENGNVIAKGTDGDTTASNGSGKPDPEVSNADLFKPLTDRLDRLTKTAGTKGFNPEVARDLLARAEAFTAEVQALVATLDETSTVAV